MNRQDLQVVTENGMSLYIDANSHLKVVPNGPMRKRRYAHIYPGTYYERILKKLGAVDAPRLSESIFHFFEHSLEYPFGNHICYSVLRLAHMYGVSDNMIYLAMGKLFKADLIRKVRKQEAKLDPYLAFAGDEAHLQYAREAWDADLKYLPRFSPKQIPLVDELDAVMDQIADRKGETHFTEES